MHPTSLVSFSRFHLAGLALVAILWLVAASPSHAQPATRSVVLMPSTPAVPTTNFSLPARSQAADQWWALDKAKHVTFSFLWTLSVQYVLVDKADWSNGTALPVAAGSSAAVGLSKEWFDWRYGPTQRFSTRDVVADAAGILLAIGVIVL